MLRDDASAVLEAMALGAPQRRVTDIPPVANGVTPVRSIAGSPDSSPSWMSLRTAALLALTSAVLVQTLRDEEPSDSVALTPEQTSADPI